MEERKERYDPADLIPVYVVTGDKGSVSVGPKYEEWFYKEHGKDRAIKPGDAFFNRGGRHEIVKSVIETNLPLGFVGEIDCNYLVFDDLETLRKILDGCGNAAEDLK